MNSALRLIHAKTSLIDVNIPKRISWMKRPFGLSDPAKLDAADNGIEQQVAVIEQLVIFLIGVAAGFFISAFIVIWVNNHVGPMF